MSVKKPQLRRTAVHASGNNVFKNVHDSKQNAVGRGKVTSAEDVLFDLPTFSHVKDS